jgi:hypothetical protein
MRSLTWCERNRERILEKPPGLVHYQARDLAKGTAASIVDGDACVINSKIVYLGCNESATIGSHDYKECIRVERWFVSQGYGIVCRRIENYTKWYSTDTCLYNERRNKHSSRESQPTCSTKSADETLVGLTAILYEIIWHICQRFFMLYI